MSEESTTWTLSSFRDRLRASNGRDFAAVLGETSMCGVRLSGAPGLPAASGGAARRSRVGAKTARRTRTYSVDGRGVDRSRRRVRFAVIVGRAVRREEA